MLTVKTRTTTYFVPIRDILYIESRARKLHIHKQNEVIECYGKLPEFLERLSGEFMLCHQSFCVNLRQVRELERTRLVVANGDRLPISRARSAETRERIREILQLREEA